MLFDYMRCLQAIQLRIFRFFLFIHHSILWILAGLFFGFTQPRNAPRTVLVLRTGALGDFLFAIPSFSILRKRFPDARIILLTISTTNAADRGAVDRYTGVHAYPWLSFVVPSLIDDVVALKSMNPTYLLREIKPVIEKLNPSLTFILSHPGEWGLSMLKKIVFLRILGVRRGVYGWRTRSIYGFMRAVQYRAGLLQHKVMGPVNAIMECNLVPKVHDKDIQWDIHINPESSLWVNSEWTRRNWGARLVVGFAPGALRSFKAWPAAQYVQLGHWLLRNSATTIVVLGTTFDLDVASEICAALGDRAVNLAGQCDVHQSAALMKKCRFLVANDGGAPHLANAVDCPCITISNENEYPGSVEPWFSKHLSVRHHVPCAPCYTQTYCPKGHCLCVKGIRVEQVMQQCTILCPGIFDETNLQSALS